MDDVLAVLGRISTLVEGARAMPMSASCVVNRADLLAMVEELRVLLPEAFSKAQGLLQDRDGVIADGRAEADRILEEAREEQRRLVEAAEVFQVAQGEASRLLEEARASSDAMRVEVEDYVDAKLANFEIVLEKTIKTVTRGREKLSGRHELDVLQGGDLDDETPPLPG